MGGAGGRSGEPGRLFRRGATPPEHRRGMSDTRSRVRAERGEVGRVGGGGLAHERACAESLGRRRQPERTVLHAAVRAELETFVHRRREPDGGGLPGYVEGELRRYLACGLLAHGFTRVRCAGCKAERLVAFSCKGRGV